MKDLLTGNKLGAKIQSQTEYPYLERWRDWPYEARQPAILLQWCQFLQDYVVILGDETGIVRIQPFCSSY
ncbi:hypothetical protein DH09_14480 [Bacillaceae bacterium JMAK1]|nr:hypothetical protein DH09_14480 [Bacillaceae bacterium JMAK1]